jgi:DNA polymerase-3 subunit gamma/tau
LSLKDILNPKTEEKANAAYIEERAELFSQDDLSDRWRKFAYSVKLKDLDLYSTLTVNEPVLKEGFLIQLAIFNKAQAVDVNNKKVELLNYLREQLNNTKIDLELVIDKEAETKGVYTIKDKYEKLVELNPAVDVFRKKFDLHF